MSILTSILSAVLGHAPSPAPYPHGVAPAPAAPVDVAAVMEERAKAHGEEQLNWRESITDLLKLLGLDSSPEARVSLAEELGYSGDMHDSAAMNVWLHKQVMQKLAEHGGNVPDELKT